MAAIWKGSIAFGLVNIPVRMETAVRSHDVSFRLLHEEDLSPVRYEKVCKAEGEPVPWDEIIKGYEYRKGQYVVLDEDDFQRAALESSDSIEILDFVDDDEIDIRFFDKPYFLVPDRGGEKAYALLREAIRQTGSTGVGKVVLRKAQHLAAIRVDGEALLCETMRFADELIDPSEFAFPDSEGVRPQEMEMATQLIGNLTAEFDPGQYTDEYRENLMRIIRAKTEGMEVELEEPEHASEDGKVIDLMARLKASLEQAGEKGEAKPERAKAKSSKGGKKKAKKKSA
jgi:DNA end-binding protein Ku